MAALKKSLGQSPEGAVPGVAKPARASRRPWRRRRSPRRLGRRRGAGARPGALDPGSGGAGALSGLGWLIGLIGWPVSQADVSPLLEADFAVDVVAFSESAEFLIADAALWAFEVPEADHCRARACHGTRLRRVAASWSAKQSPAVRMLLGHPALARRMRRFPMQLPRNCSEDGGAEDNHGRDFVSLLSGEVCRLRDPLKWHGSSAECRRTCGHQAAQRVA